ncbi:glycosyltransferase family 4 protein [Campylobacter lari]|nr:glycosyltransferase family 4 protein [Campylobacter lari]MCV3398426.1 glycosyltransferase family 4 protein [Campylobacter lari]
MKILLVEFDITIMGGVNRVIANLANALLEKSFHVDILSIYKENTQIPFCINENIGLKFFYENGAKKIKTKNIFQNLYKKSIEKRIRDYRIKKIANDYDIVIFNNYFLYNSFFKNKKTKYIKILHGQFENYTDRDLNRNKFFDTIVLLSSKQLNEFQKYFKNIKIIPNFVNIPLKIADCNQKIVLSIGRLSEEKGFLRLVDIWEIAQKKMNDKNWKLHIIGEGELKKELESKIKDKNLEDSIKILPFTQNINKHYLNASIYIMCSYSEGMPMVLLESSSFGLPNIAFDVKTGPSDIIENNKSGFLVKDGDLHEFADKLIFLMGNDNARKEMGKYARVLIDKKFSKEVVIKKWFNL